MGKIPTSPERCFKSLLMPPSIKLVGLIIPNNNLIVVVFSAPFKPTKPYISPGATESDNSFTAANVPNFLVRLNDSITFIF